MKTFLPLLLLFTVLTLSLGCKSDKVDSARGDRELSASNSIVSENNVTDTSIQLKGVSLDSSLIKAETKRIQDSIRIAEELLEKAKEIKAEAKAASALKKKPKKKPIKKVKKKPIKKPESNPVESPPTKYLPKIVFDEMTYDFGEITEGDIIKHNFNFTNTGKLNLSVEKATASCGCTKPSFPFIDIEPGQTGYIGVTYNSVNKNGDQKPKITVFSNAYPNEMTLYLTGTVKPKPQEEKEEIKDSTVIEMIQDTVKN